MADATRRGFIAAAGAGAATVAVVAAAPSAFAAPTSAAEAAEALSSATLVAYIQNPKSGVVTVMVGEDEVEIHDPALVRRLTKAARS